MINYFASDKIPYQFYGFKFFYAQWSFIFGFVTSTPIIFTVFHKHLKSKTEAKEQTLENERLKKEYEEKKAIESKLRAEKEKRLKEEEERQERDEKAILEKKIKEFNDPDPWGSGFLG